MSFDKIYGHKRQIKFIKNAIINDRVPNAYLFSGIDGIGKKTVALALAKALNCLEEYGLGCNRCLSCRKIENGNHPDVMVISPKKALKKQETGGETESGKETIRIEQIREIQRIFTFSIFEGRHRVLIIDQAEKMSMGASNCLLKLIEEPPLRTLVIIICRAPHNLLPTIVSRCQKVYFNPIPEEIIRDAIVHLGKGNEMEAKNIASLSGGSMKKALELTESLFYQRRKEIFVGLLEVPEKSLIDLFNFCDKISKKKEELQEILEGIKTLFRDILLWSYFRDGGLIMNCDLLGEIERASSTFTIDAIIKIMEITGKAQILLDQNINPRLLSESLVMELRKLSKNG